MSNRNEEILNLYKNGKTLEEISKVFKVTRSRIQQIVVNQMENEIKASLNITYYLSQEDRKMLKIAAHEEIKQIALDRYIQRSKNEKECIEIKIRENSVLQDPSEFFGVSTYARAIGVDSVLLKKYFPEIVEKINMGKEKRWARDYEECKMCETSSIPHKIRGYCMRCYTKSPYFKQVQRTSFLKHIDDRKKKMKEYMEEYKTRPEVKERFRKANDHLNFDGNRQKALERDAFKCTNCGLTQEESYEKFGRDLFVQHINGKSNGLSNLKTVCRSCHSEKIMRMARQIGSETLLQRYMRMYGRTGNLSK